jgi:hypothetical protein
MYPGQTAEALALEQARVNEGGMMPSPASVAPIISTPQGQDPSALAVTQVSSQLQPDIRRETSRTTETPEMLARREAAEKAAREAVAASEVAAYGAPASIVAAQPPPQIAPIPQAVPSLEGLTGGIQQMQTKPAQEEANRAATALVEKEAADAYYKQLEAAEKEANEKREAARWRYATAAADYDRTRTKAEEKEEKSFAIRILTALAVGGGAYAAIRGGTRNFALDVINSQLEADEKHKKNLLESSFKNLELAQKNLTEAEKMEGVEKQDARSLAMKKAKLARVATASNVVLAKFPDLQLKVQEAIAQKRAELDEKARQNIEKAGYVASSKAESQMGQRQMTQAPGAGRGPTESEAKLALLGQSMKDELKAIKAGAKLTPDDLDKVQADTLRAENADIAAEKGGQISGVAVQAGRSIGAVPKSRYSSLPEEKQKTMNAWDNAVEKYARMLTGAGMPAEEARRMARQNGPMAGDTPGQIEAKLQRLDREAERMVGLAGQSAISRSTGGARVPPEGQTPAQKRYTAEVSKEISGGRRRKLTGAEMAANRSSLSGQEKQIADTLAKTLADKNAPAERKAKAEAWLKNKGLR